MYEGPPKWCIDNGIYCAKYLSRFAKWIYDKEYSVLKLCMVFWKFQNCHFVQPVTHSGKRDTLYFPKCISPMILMMMYYVILSNVAQIRLYSSVCFLKINRIIIERNLIEVTITCKIFMCESYKLFHAWLSIQVYFQKHHVTCFLMKWRKSSGRNCIVGRSFL